MLLRQQNLREGWTVGGRAPLVALLQVSLIPTVSLCRITATQATAAYPSCLQLLLHRCGFVAPMLLSGSVQSDHEAVTANWLHVNEYCCSAGSSIHSAGCHQRQDYSKRGQRTSGTITAKATGPPASCTDTAGETHLRSLDAGLIDCANHC